MSEPERAYAVASLIARVVVRACDERKAAYAVASLIAGLLILNEASVISPP